jgi:hypothetical protein
MSDGSHGPRHLVRLEERPRRDFRWEFVSEQAVTIWEAERPLTTGHGKDRAAALLAAWTTFRGRDQEAAAYVAEKYERLTGSVPVWPTI